MLVRAFAASVFSLRGGILMENVYHAPRPASRARMPIFNTRSTRIPMDHPLAKKRGAPMSPSKVWRTGRTKARKHGKNL